MVLNDRQIIELCQHRLVLPFDRDRVNSSSLDICIGNRLKVEAEEGWWNVDISDRTKDDPFYLSPGQFCLSSCLEYLIFPDTICAMFRLKSSRAREGYEHAEAGWIDPGWQGRMTFEIKNHLNYHRLPLYPGLRIGQLVFFSVDCPDRPYNGHYQGDRCVRESVGSPLHPITGYDNTLEKYADVTDHVIADLQQRRQFGVEKYGQPLMPFNGRRSLQDFYEELMDATLYVKQHLIEIESFPSLSIEEWATVVRLLGELRDSTEEAGYETIEDHPSEIAYNKLKEWYDRVV